MSPSAERSAKSCIPGSIGARSSSIPRVSSPTPTRSSGFPELPYLTLRLAYMACEYFNADLGLAIVRAEHQAFYRRVFLHETIAEPRMFPGLLKPVGLMAADFPTMREKVFERYPMMRSTAFERRMLFERAGDAPRRPARWLPRLRAGLDGSEFLNRPDCGESGRQPVSASAARNGRSSASRAGVFRPDAPKAPNLVIWGGTRLPSPSRHIYKPLTIAVAFHGLSAFDRVRQGSIKVDGTFA